ncbi:hypothetical protein TNCV_2596751 [Trichonephila clavipes]|nr:hypothetical protein TNCV_2596751 [Trichonephila clavipes]
MKAKADYAHLSIYDHWALRCISRCPDQGVGPKRDPYCLILNQDCYSFIDPMKECNGESKLAQPTTPMWWRNPRTEPRTFAARGLLTTDHVILNHGQVTWMTPELAPLSPNYHTTPTGKRFNS